MINILKSDSDRRDYKYIELDNKLKVILVKDKLSMSCGALLNINVGSVQDTLPGMAHFLEHMVFMGSEKYPDQNNFMESVFKSGGITNAMTGDTHTTYYFTIETDKYLKNLDMLAHFFINPLLKNDDIQKEVNAVNAESVKNMSDDNWLFHDMIKKTLDKNHPINQYTCGNNDTLKDEHLDSKVKEFYETYYSANIMQLVLFINDKINDKINEEDFIKYIIETFGKIKNRKIKINNSYDNLLIPNNMVKYNPITDIDSLTICTELPKNFESIQTSTIDLLNWILQSKTKNSLFKKLEEKGLLIDIDCAEIFTFDNKILYITEFTLTKKGIKEYDRIIRIYFDYIKSIIKCKYIEDIYNDLLKKYRREFNLSFSEDIVDSLLEINILLNKNIHPLDINIWGLNKPKFNLIENKFNNTIHFVVGGETRFHSVKNGLSKVTQQSIVFVHDAVRCLLTPALIQNCYQQAVNKGSAIPAVSATDTIRLKEGEQHRLINREQVMLIQTPQTFQSEILLKAFEQDYQSSFTDEANVVEKAGFPVFLIEGEFENIKITRPLDMAIANFILSKRIS